MSLAVFSYVKLKEQDFWFLNYYFLKKYYIEKMTQFTASLADYLSTTSERWLYLRGAAKGPTV